MLEEHLEKLIAFVGVVKAGSIRKYALNRRLSQPGVSQRIAALERQIGLSLLNRSRTGIELTKHGKSIYQLGINLIEQTQATELKIYSENLREVDIVFGTYDSIAIYLMPNVIKELQSRLPHVKLKILCDRSSVIISKLEEGLLDCALSMVFKKSKRIEISSLYEDHYGFFKSVNSVNDTLITVVDAQDSNGKTIGSYLKTFGLSKVHLLSVPSFEVAKAMTLSGLGIGVLPSKVAFQHFRSGKLKRANMPAEVPAFFGTHSFGFIRRKGIPESAEVKIFSEIIQNHQYMLK